MSIDDRVVLGIAELQEAKRIRSLLEEQGIRIELVSNPRTCSTGGCQVTVELRAHPNDAPAFEAFVKKERERELAELEVDPELLEQVFDPERESATCPACGTSFSTSSRECPDCGLVFVQE
jgi:hypothetical protein